MEPLIGEGFFLMALAFAVVLARRFAQTHSDLEVSYAENVALNKGLEQKVTDRTAELQQKNNQITESIEYASMIQRSVLPEDSQLAEVFTDHFVSWKPRDLVGGDSYWFSRREGQNDFSLAVYDCTGHGVPGALLAMTASATLDSLAFYSGETDPVALLNLLDTTLVRKLHQDRIEDVTDDGLDIALCHYRADHRILSFAGAKLSLFVYLDGQVTEVRGERRGIGYSRQEKDKDFTLHEIPVTSAHRFYLMTDGIPDQNGGTSGYGFGRRQFREVVSSLGHLPMAEQKEAFDRILVEWRKNEPQRDDISLIGFQISMTGKRGS